MTSVDATGDRPTTLTVAGHIHFHRGGDLDPLSLQALALRLTLPRRWTWQPGIAECDVRVIAVHVDVSREAIHESHIIRMNACREYTRNDFDK